MKDRRKKPSKGIVAFSVILALLGTVNFLAIIISFFQLRLELFIKDYHPNLFHQFPLVTINFTAFWFSTILSIVISLSWIIASIGAFILKEWARQMLLISMGIYFLNKVMDIFINVILVKEFAETVPMLQLTIGILYVLILTVSTIHFFTHPSVIKQFNREQRYRIN